MASSKKRTTPPAGAREHASTGAALPVDDETFERAAAFFRAAGDVSRLKILARLAAGEWNVTDLAEAADAGMSTVSQQLRLLRAERLVKRYREGKHVFYKLADNHIRRLIRAGLEHASHATPPGGVSRP